MKYLLYNNYHFQIENTKYMTNGRGDNDINLTACMSEFSIFYEKLDLAKARTDIIRISQNSIILFLPHFQIILELSCWYSCRISGVLCPHCKSFGRWMQR